MNKKHSVILSSLDCFHLPLLQLGLSREFETKFVSTWSLKREGPNPELPRRNLWPMHYALQAYKMVDWLKFNNQTYSALVSAFDTWLTAPLKPRDWDAYIPLSGVALQSGKKFQRLGKPVILECGSTHTNHQHRVVFGEYKRNGIMEPLFPESY